MVYTKRPPKSYGGRNCGHRRNIFENHCSSLCVQTSSGAHPASYPMSTAGGPFPGVKHGLGVTLTAHPHLVLRSRISKSYISSPLVAYTAVAGQLYLLYSIELLWRNRERIDSVSNVDEER
jgi:hypothetical protein